MDTYGPRATTAICAQCARFMPWERSVVVEKYNPWPVAALALVETGVCHICAEAKEDGDDRRLQNDQAI